MLVPSLELLHALHALNKQNSKEWNIMKSWFSQSFNVQTGMMIDTDDKEQRAVFAGRCRELKENLFYFDNAGAILLESEKKATQVDAQDAMAMEEVAKVID
jgi:hypothetical protein